MGKILGVLLNCIPFLSPLLRKAVQNSKYLLWLQIVGAAVAGGAMQWGKLSPQGVTAMQELLAALGVTGTITAAAMQPHDAIQEVHNNA
jgi:hypothetical protein